MPSKGVDFAKGLSNQVEGLLPSELQVLVGKALKKTIKSVIMIIAGGGGGSAVGDHTLLGFFFNAPKLVV